MFAIRASRAAIIAAIVLIFVSSNASAQTADDLQASERRATRLYRIGEYLEAIPIAERARELTERQFGSKDLKVADWLDNIAELYRKRVNQLDRSNETREQRYLEAEKRYKRALEIREEALGSDHADLVANLEKLASLYKEQDRFSDADPYYQRAVSVAEKAWGPDQHATKDLLEEYAAFLEAFAQSYPSPKSPQAKALMKRADEVHKKLCGRDIACQRAIEKTVEQPVVVKGMFAFGYPEAGALLKGSDPQSAGAWCSGTLVGCDKFLTAAHCIVDEPNPSTYHVFFQNAGFFPVQSIDWPKEEYRSREHTGDIAVLTLARPVEHIAPMEINRQVVPKQGTAGTIVGFGRTGGDNLDYGIKREGRVTTAACPPQLGGKKFLCWNFDADEKSTSNSWHSNTCNGDSGGGLLISLDKRSRSPAVLAGVTVAGLRGDCLEGDRSYDTDVFSYAQWVNQVGEGRLSAKACGPLGPLKLDDVEPTSITLSESQPRFSVQFVVPPDLTGIRVAMNGEDDGNHDSDFDLYVIPGADGDTASKAACTQEGSGQFAFCDIQNPTAGTWTALVRRKKGEGHAQLTITRMRPSADKLVVAAAAGLPRMTIGSEFRYDNEFNLPQQSELRLRRSSDGKSFDMRGPYQGTLAKFLMDCAQSSFMRYCRK
jgi:Trypsin/Tetratricopeptide repeat